MALEVENGAAAEHEGEISKVVFTAVKPWLVVEDSKANDAVEFYKAAFGAEEVSRVNHPKRKAEQEVPLLLSAELKLGSSVIVVSDLTDAELKAASSKSLFYLETENVETAVAKAVAAGAVADGEITEAVGKVKDPYGNIWQISEPAAAAKKAAVVDGTTTA
ncbi:hypothetical protein M569_17011 [Genlisea aurea]|uniref:Uncharacterized protein n=1 Tax=Genlisea aurea TaxID=192259 RepID=S8C026_9LAMI|nr:hypothetical protein M569_17011 [Genlisea aurea]